MTEIKKKFSWKNILFIGFIIVLLIPQTRVPIQVALNKVKVAVFKPSAFAKADQYKLPPFNYVVKSMDGLAREVPIGQGKVTFISYWATWCPPCIAELPSIEALYADYGNKVQFVLLTNEDPEVVTKFLDKKGLNLPAVSPVMNAPELLYERSIPTNYVIDKEGTIVIKEKGAANWDSENVRNTLERLLKS